VKSGIQQILFLKNTVKGKNALSRNIVKTLISEIDVQMLQNIG